MWDEPRMDALLAGHADVIVSGRHDRQVSYRLQLKAVNGQWMVAAINPA